MPKGGDLPCALFFPADYSVGVANLGVHYIYRTLKELGVGVERFFASPISTRSVETDERLGKHTLILTSMSYEGDFYRFCDWLLENSIPLLSEKRNWNGAPLIGAGGAVTYINPLLLSGICDFIVMGDGVSAMADIVQEIRSAQNQKMDKTHLLAALAQIKGVLVPSIHLRYSDQNQLLHVLKSDGSDMGLSSWITPKSVFGKTLLIELQRGCCRKCRYCTLPSCFAPFRQRKVEDICHDIEELSQKVSFDQVGLVTPEAGDYPQLSKILGCLKKNKKSVSFASLRADALSEEMVQALTSGGRRSITLAPETGSDLFRAECGKSITNDQFVEASILAAKNGAAQVKLYFMVGLPGEDESEMEQIARLAHRISAESLLKVHLSVGQFIPKPKTAWETAPFAERKIIKKRYQMLSSHIGKIFAKAPLLRFTSPKEAEMEFMLTWFSYEQSRKYALSFGKQESDWKNEMDRDRVVRTLQQLGIY